ncbi:MAG TPA: ATP-binding cassette domain-containing protein [Pseudomonadales bacterium]
MRSPIRSKPRRASAGVEPALGLLLARLLPEHDRQARERLRAALRAGDVEEAIAELAAAGLLERRRVDDIAELEGQTAVCRLPGQRWVLLQPAGSGRWSVAAAGRPSRLLGAAALRALLPCDVLLAGPRNRPAAEPRAERVRPRYLSAGLRLTAQVLGLATPVAMLLVIDKVVTQGAQNTLLALVGGVALLTVFQYLFLLCQTVHACREAEAGALPSRRRLFHRALASSAAPRSCSAGWDVLDGCHEHARFEAETRPQALADAAFAALLGALMAAFSPVLLAVSAAFVPLYLLAETWARGFAERHAAQAAGLRHALSRNWFEALGAAELVQGLGLAPHLGARWDAADLALAGSRYRSAVCRRLASLAVEFLQKVSLVVIMLLGVGAVIGGELTLGQYVAFNLLSMQLAAPVMRLAGYRRAHIDQRLHTESRNELEQAWRAAEWPPAGGYRVPGGATLLEADGLPAPGSGRAGFVLRAGSWLGITGPSGCGKTTLLRTLAGLRIADGAAVRLNGIPIGRLDPAERGRQIRLAAQEPVLFSASIAENIRLGDLDAGPERVLAAALACGLGPLLERLPEHLDTVVGPGGRPLSGGERQRVAIARAMLASPRVLLLDEATAALDAAGEAAVLAALRRHLPDAVVVVVSHRATSLARCDRLLRFDADGRIAEAPARRALHGVS